MSDTSNFDVELPDGRVITVEGAPNADAARQRVTSFLQEERRARPLGGFFENFARAGRGALGSVVEGAGAVAGEAGLPGEQTLREVGAGITGQTPTDRHSFENFSDLRDQFMRRPGETTRAALGQALGSLAGSVAAPVAVGAGLAAAGAGAPVVAGAGLAAAIASGALQSTNELEEILQQEGVDAPRARELAVQVGPVIGAMEGGAAGALLSRVLGRQIRRESAERLARIAARSRTASGVREAGIGAALEGGSEGLGGAARQGVAATETGNLNLGERADQVALDALLGAVGGGGVGAVGGARQPGQASRELASLPGPPVPPDLGREPTAQTPPEEFGPTAPSLPPEPPLIEDLDTARQVLARDNIALPNGIDDAGIVAMANLSERARYRDQVAQVRDNEVARFTGLRDVIVRPGEPNADGVADDTADFTRAAPTLIRNVLSAMQSGTIEGERFTSRQVVGLAVEGLGLEASAVPRSMQTVVTQYLDGLAQAGYLNKTGKSYKINLRTREPQGARAVDGNLTTEERSAQAVLPLLQTYQNNPTNANRQAAERAARGTQLETEVSKFFTLQQERQGYINGRNTLTQKPALTEQESEDLRNLEADIATTSTNLARIVDSLEGRAQGRAIAMPGKAPQFSDQVGRSQPAVDPDEEAFNQEFAREMAGSMESLTAPLRPNPNEQIDEAQIARTIIERPAEAEAFVRNLTAGLPAGRPFFAANIRNAARSNGIQISDQTAIQLYNVARQTGIVTRTGTIAKAKKKRPANFAAANTFSPQTQLDADIARQAGEEAFRRVLGQNGRLQIQDRIFLEELGDVVRKAAEDAGVKEADGVALDDLAILALRDRTTPITQIAIHEGWHIAENLRLFTSNELAILNANLDKIRTVIQRYIPNIAAQKLANPAEVRAYGLNARVFQNADFGSLINSIFDKFVNFIERIGNFVRGQGFQSWRDVYDAFNAGGMANRRPAEATTNINFMGRPGQTQTEEFKKWFGNSKIVDENGNPLVMYHGSPNNIEKFRHRSKTSWGTEATGIYLTSSPRIASEYSLNLRGQNGSLENAAVYPVYIKIEKPKYVDRPTVSLITPEELQQYLRDGFDGLIYRDPVNPDFNEYVVFDPTQVKSAVGNRGTWDGDSEYINFSAAGTLMGLAGTGTGSPHTNQLRQGARTQATHRAAKDELTGLLRWFGSPIMTIGKVLPNHRAAADTQKQLYTRSNEMINETESLIEAAYRLPPQSVAKITRVWNEANRKRQAPNLSGLNAAERDALRQQMAATQRGLDYMIESMVLDNFLPNQAKNPAVRQRLEAFWNRHQDKHLWEIPQRELMAASPEGYREMQRLERLRNPYYMPMVGRGSHFVAAYQRKPNGDRGKIVGLVAYEPLTIRQKLLRKWNRAADPEQAAILQLQNEFNDPRKYIVMQNGVQFTNDSQAEQIRAQGDFIAQYMEKVRQAASATGNTKVLETVRAMTAQIDKAQLERIFRPNNDILRAVTPQNESSYILDVMPQYLLSLAKVQARRYTQEGFKDATKNMTPNDREYWTTTRDYATSPSEAFGNLRALAFFQYLGFALDTAFINLTQNLHSNAMLTRDGGLVGSKIFAQVAGRMGVNADAKTLTDPSGFVKNYITKYASANEKVALERAMEQGIFAPVFTNESRSQFTVEGLRRAGFKNPQKMHQRFTKLSRWAGLPMQFVEAYNRAVAFTAAYKLAEQNPSVIARANQVDGTQYANPYDYAVGKVIDTQFLTTKEDRALFQRFTPAAELATQFLSYPFKAMEQYARAGVQTIKGMAQSDPVMARAGAVNLLLMMGPLIMLAGVFALPFADFAKELAEDLVGAVWGSPQNFEMDMREMLGGGRGAEFVLGGGLQAAGIATLRRRLALDPIPYNDLLSINTIGNLFGPAGSMIEIPQNAYQYYQNGDYMQMAASLMPRAAGNVVRGAQIAIEEQQYTRRGNRVITPETVQEAGNLFGGVLPANISAGARTAFGFAPPEFAREREIVSTAEELSRATRSRSERYSKELARILVNMLEAQRNNNMDEAASLGRQYGDRLREISEAELERPAHLQVMPNHQSILRRALRDFYGIGSEEALSTTGRRNAREEVLRQRALIDWRNQQN